MRKLTIKFILLSVSCGLLIFQGSASYAQRSSNDKKQAIKVLVQPVSFSANTRVFEAVGTGKAKLSANIHPSLAEEVISINFKAQDKVNKGDVLVQLDDRTEKLALQLAEVELKDAQSLLDRYKKAGKAGAVPQSEVDSSQATHDGAIVALEQAKLNLEERQIIAPFDGVVGIPNVDPGDLSAVEIVLGMYAPITSISTTFLASAVAFDIDFRKNFEPSLQTRHSSCIQTWTMRFAHSYSSGDTIGPYSAQWVPGAPGE